MTVIFKLASKKQQILPTTVTVYGAGFASHRRAGTREPTALAFASAGGKRL